MQKDSNKRESALPLLALFFATIVFLFYIISAHEARAQDIGSASVGDCSRPFIWTQNLSLGMSSLDVLHLQQILNIDPSTTIAASGPGSPGNETFYFGSLTQAAVMRFQEKYAQNILFPAGLTAPTGYVGVATRSWLIALCDNY